MKDQWFHKIFSVTDKGFEQLALEIFRFQYQNNSVYRAYTDMLKINPAGIDTISEIPFLPIHFFKTHAVKTTDFEPAAIFESSGTTQTTNSRHYVKDIGLYERSFLEAFELFYGPVNEWCIIGLLPSYLERKNSSLIFMTEHLIQRSQHPQSGFYVYDHDKLHDTLKELENDKQKTLLIGVSFALLDFAEKYSLKLENTVVMETGGMKGRKNEMIRNELHEILRRRFHLSTIHSEYGMTEILSQAYSQGNGIFHCPAWMRILIRDEEDPLSVQSGVQSLEPATLRTHYSQLTTHDSILTTRGAINIIDLANIYSCSFIATDDAGTLYGDGSFEILGRIDNSDIRGCSLMAI
jgi:hypothetical protein